MKKILFAILILCLSAPAFAADKKESAYDRVMRTHTLRCAYIVWPPEMMKDLNTGAFSGLSYDIAEEIGRRLHLKVDWTEEVNFGTMTEGLKTGRYDAVCFASYRYTQAATVADFSAPLYYSGTGVYVRADDHRFDAGLAALDSADMKIATSDGEMSQFIAAEDYPKAKTVSLPQFTDMSQALENVAAKKADVTFVNQLTAKNYMKANPGKLRDISAGHPVRLFSQGFVLPKGEYDFVKMLDLAIAEMHDHGFIDKAIDKYDDEKLYIRAAKPYELKK